MRCCLYGHLIWTVATYKKKYKTITTKAKYSNSTRLLLSSSCG